MKLNHAWYLICILIIASCSEKKSEISKRRLHNFFTGLDASETNIDFANNVNDGDNFNILTYRNFYNGGGVAIGDINNDSLPDIYFTANQQKE